MTPLILLLAEVFVEKFLCARGDAPHSPRKSATVQINITAAQIEYALKNGAGRVILVHLARDDCKGVWSDAYTLTAISELTRGIGCSLKKCP